MKLRDVVSFVSEVIGQYAIGTALGGGIAAATEAAFDAHTSLPKGSCGSESHLSFRQGGLPANLEQSIADAVPRVGTRVSSLKSRQSELMQGFIVAIVYLMLSYARCEDRMVNIVVALT